MECGMIWYTHISKTGGTTVQVMLQEEAGLYNWSFHDSLFLTFTVNGTVPPERAIPAGSKWYASPAWQWLVDDLEKPKPRVIVHHHDGMPGLSNPDLRSFLAATRSSLREQGCDLLMTTTLRSPVTRAVSDGLFHHNRESAQLRAFTSLESDYQTKYLMYNMHKHEWTYEHSCDAPTLAATAGRADDGTYIWAAPSDKCLGNNPTLSPTAPIKDAQDMLALYDLVGNTNQLYEFLQQLHVAITDDGSEPMSGTCGSACIAHELIDDVPEKDMLHVYDRNEGDLLLLSDLYSWKTQNCSVVRSSRKEMRKQMWERFENSSLESVADLGHLTPNTAVANMLGGTPPSDPNYENRADNRSLPNLIYVRIPKTASDETAALARRLSAKNGVNGYNRHQKSPDDDEQLSGVREMLPWGEPGLWATHGARRKLDDALSEMILPKFVFTLVRHPVERCMSEFYVRSMDGLWDDTATSKKDSEPNWSTSAKLAFLNSSSCENFQVGYMSPKKWDGGSSPKRSSIEKMLDHNYDFVGLDSMLDMSAVLLGEKLGVPLQDVLYLDARVEDGPAPDDKAGNNSTAGNSSNASGSGGGSGDGSHREHKDPGTSLGLAASRLRLASRAGLDSSSRLVYQLARRIPFRDEPQEVRDFASSVEFKKKVSGDAMLAEIVEDRLMASFKASAALRNKLAVFKKLRTKSTSACANFQQTEPTNCYWGDEGCGYHCLDHVTHGCKYHC
jgi:hypothetical protein